MLELLGIYRIAHDPILGPRCIVKTEGGNTMYEKRDMRTKFGCYIHFVKPGVSGEVAKKAKARQSLRMDSVKHL
jgi:hypothetical protein